jgi:hypothetical protein
MPTVADELADKVNTLLLVAGFELNVGVTPAGCPEAAKVTLPLNPFCGEMVIVEVVLAP